MAGQQARCTCGAVLSIPAAGAVSNAPQDDIWSDTIGGIGGTANDEYQVAPDNEADPFAASNVDDSVALGTYTEKSTKSKPSGDGVFDGGVAAGVGLIALAVVLAFAGLAIGFRIRYAAVLLVIGIGMVIKGIVSGN
jgi:hypothetical protein